MAYKFLSVTRRLTSFCCNSVVTVIHTFYTIILKGNGVLTSWTEIKNTQVCFSMDLAKKCSIHYCWLKPSYKINW